MCWAVYDVLGWFAYVGVCGLFAFDLFCLGIVFLVWGVTLVVLGLLFDFVGLNLFGTWFCVLFCLVYCGFWGC